VSNLIFAAGLVALACAQGPVGLTLAWVVIGIGMGAGLYESAFATLAAIWGAAARSPITGITLIAGFASTVGWPLSGLMLAQWGWREACLGWAVLHLVLALPLNLILPPAAAGVGHAVATGGPGAPEGPADGAPPGQSPLWPMILLAFVFAATWFTSTAMAAHLPRLLEAAGASTAAAIAAGALIGPAQVGARVLEWSLLRRMHPLVSARWAAASHPLAAVVLVIVGGPAAAVFAILHGAGNGILTIAKGTLPLALFGPVGYGARLGWIGAPSRLLQAAAPLVFGAALTAWGLHAIWLTAGVSAASLGALCLLRRTR
jgi:hypothetical protein